MISQTAYFISPYTNPDQNFALETYLMETVPEGSCRLYLWQNERTVVIGRNQDANQECKLIELSRDGGHLVRRQSGGGAVYHDMGNLNFTFLLNSPDYDVDRQLEVILQALGQLGILAEKSGRNDLLVEGKKFSGNAFYHSKGKSYHHGTLLVDAELAMLAHYLKVSPEKLQAKGVASVHSLVANLKSFCPSLTVSALADQLINAFGQVYGADPQVLTEADFDQKRLFQLMAESGTIPLGHSDHLSFSHRLTKRFPWGEIDLRLLVEQGLVVLAIPYSDGINGALIEAVGRPLVGCPLDPKMLAQALEPLCPAEEIQDIQALIQAADFSKEAFYGHL